MLLSLIREQVCFIILLLQLWEITRVIWFAEKQLWTFSSGEVSVVALVVLHPGKMVFFLCIGNEFLLNTALSQSDFFCLQKNFEWAGKGETSLLEVFKMQHFMPGHFSIAQIANTLPFTDSSLSPAPASASITGFHGCTMQLSWRSLQLQF